MSHLWQMVQQGMANLQANQTEVTTESPAFEVQAGGDTSSESGVADGRRQLERRPQQLLTDVAKVTRQGVVTYATEGPRGGDQEASGGIFSRAVEPATAIVGSDDNEDKETHLRAEKKETQA